MQSGCGISGLFRASMHFGHLAVLSTAWLARPPLHAAHGCVRRARPPMAKTVQHTFNATHDTLAFGCRQKSVTVVRPERAGTLAEFMSTQAGNVLVSSWGDGEVKELGDGEYLFESARLAPQSAARGLARPHGARAAPGPPSRSTCATLAARRSGAVRVPRAAFARYPACPRMARRTHVHRPPALDAART